jgi:hypothetical protein
VGKIHGGCIKDSVGVPTLALIRSAATLFLLTLLLACVAPGIENVTAQPSTSYVNLDHFDHLYTEISLDDKTVGVVRIYSVYPDYDYAIEPAEGFTCVDDAARAIVMLSQIPESGRDEEVIRRINMLVEFLLHMQHKNGYFNNFLWSDYSINRVYKTSVAELNWWSLRALWALETALPILRSDADLVARIDTAIAHLVGSIKNDVPVTSSETVVVKSIELPNWLPHKYAADQAAVLIMGLLPYYLRTGDDEAPAIIHAMARGIITMQKGDADNYPYGMFLSWENSWHAWGNSQSYALLLAGQVLNTPEYIQSALEEIDYFYPYLLASGFAKAISIKATEHGYSELERTRYPQIAYGIRPMVYAAAEAYRVTGRQEHLELARKIALWFVSDNDVGKPMYSQLNGMTYDGIVSGDRINLDSGAESTIEGLMVIQMNLL